jgi:hypothetical protein
MNKKQWFSLAVGCTVPFLSHAANPWLPASQQWQASLGILQQTADELYAGETRAALPTDLEQTSFTLNASYGVNHALALDLSTGYAKSDFIEVPGLSPNAEESGLQDVRLGVRYLLRDEVVTEDFTLTADAAFIIGGGYDVGALNSIGDDADGVETSLHIGRQFSNNIALAAQLGYRWRGDAVPNERFGSADATYRFNSVLAARVGYSFVNANSGIDIGSATFTPARFPEVEEDYQLLSGGVSLAITPQTAIQLSYGQKVDGRNTARSDVWAAHLGVSW